MKIKEDFGWLSSVGAIVQDIGMNKERYMDSVPEDRIRLVAKLHALIMGLYPNAEVDMSYKMPTYKAKDGWVALANQKHYISLYTCGPHHLSEFKEKYPNIKTGKGCITLSPTMIFLTPP